MTSKKTKADEGGVAAEKYVLLEEAKLFLKNKKV
ncbi:hypothetical protein JOD43_003777 [Pullulanibacillus pueri]|nr:hypothetical protein [Pullulanibacillus pueri]